MVSLVPRSVGYLQNSPIELYNMLDDFFSSPSGREDALKFKVDVTENEKGYKVEADLPGVKKDDLDIEMQDEKLTIGVNYDEEKDESDESKNYIHRERRHVSMQRTAYLKDADADGIEAKLEDGVLTIEVPKKNPDNGKRKISIA